MKTTEYESRIAALEEELRQTKFREQLYKMMANQVPHFSLIIFDRDMRYLIAEGEALDQAGYDRKAMVGRTIYDVIEPNEIKVLEPLYIKTLNGEITEFEHSYEKIHYTSKFLPIRDEQGKIKYGMAIIFEVTAIKNALKDAERSKEAKAQFLATMSHEIRTPLNGIIGLTDLLIEYANEPYILDNLSIIKSCSDSLLNTVNDVLDFSKIESNITIVNKKPVNLRLLTYEVQSILLPKAREKNILIEADVAEDVPEFVFGDQGKLRQILCNLMANAVKFTFEGVVHLKITQRVAQSGNVPATLIFSVSDTGIGIPEDFKDLLFQPFSQAEKTKARSFGGTGLGLAITKSLVDAMGGEIEYESTEGKGTTFHICLPFLEAEMPDSTATGENQFSDAARGLNILIAEDNVSSQFVFVKYLEQLGHNCTVVENGKLVLDSMKTKDFDLILMDCQMPILDGFDTARRITREYKNHPPIVAITASTTDEDRERCKKAGMVDILPKPIKIDTIRRLITRLTSESDH